MRQAGAWHFDSQFLHLRMRMAGYHELMSQSCTAGPPYEQTMPMRLLLQVVSKKLTGLLPWCGGAEQPKNMLKSRPCWCYSIWLARPWPFCAHSENILVRARSTIMQGPPDGKHTLMSLFEAMQIIQLTRPIVARSKSGDRQREPGCGILTGQSQPSSWHSSAFVCWEVQTTNSIEGLVTVSNG